MSYIHDRGNPLSDIWVVITKPIPSDESRKFLFSGGVGYVFNKMMEEAGLHDYFVTCFYPDTSKRATTNDVIAAINSYKPKMILAVDAAAAKFCQELIPKRRGANYDPDKDSEISKYEGSLLTSHLINYPHYVMPVIHPHTITLQYKLRDRTLLDLAKAGAELNYIHTNGCLQALPKRTLKVEFSCFDELLHDIDSFRASEYVSNDIETVYPKKGQELYGKTPGYPVVIGLANSPDYAISFDFFRESNTETAELWRHLDKLVSEVKTIGQNFFSFDQYYYEYMGFNLPLDNIRDTLIRHHVLWPELPHKLQYLCRQYTREPYYKDEGAGWNPKAMRNLKTYNAKDAAVTYEVFLAEEEEFDERPHLR